MLVFLVLTQSALAAPIAPEQLVGSWNVTMKSDYSTCDGVKKGDINAQQWVVSVASGKLGVQVLGGGNTTATYQGVVKDDLIVLISKGTANLATIELTGDASALRGRRVVANNGPCAIIYTVEAKKQ